jgi:hypothetical protein
MRERNLIAEKRGQQLKGSGLARQCLFLPGQSGKVFLQEHFVLAVLYVQLRACPAGVYSRGFLDFRKMFGATKKARHPERPRFSSRRRSLS